MMGLGTPWRNTGRRTDGWIGRRPKNGTWPRSGRCGGAWRGGRVLQRHAAPWLLSRGAGRASLRGRAAGRASLQGRAAGRLFPFRGRRKHRGGIRRILDESGGRRTKERTSGTGVCRGAVTSRGDEMPWRDRRGALPTNETPDATGLLRRAGDAPPL